MKINPTAFKNVLTECRDDYVGLWSIVRTVRESLNDKDDPFEMTLAILRKLLKEEGVVAGNFYNQQFRIWREPIDQILHKIASEWQQLGRDPNMGEIVWLTYQK